MGAQERLAEIRRVADKAIREAEVESRASGETVRIVTLYGNALLEILHRAK